MNRNEATIQQVINNFTKCGVKNEITVMQTHIQVLFQKHKQTCKINCGLQPQLKRAKAQILSGFKKKVHFKKIAFLKRGATNFRENTNYQKWTGIIE